MARLEWNKAGERFFETGLDRGVFYPKDGPGVPWNGLLGVNETPDGGEASSYYLNGQKYLDRINPEDFSGSIEALNYPPEFLPYDGMARFQGLTITGQPRRKFGLAYRTLIGSDTQQVGYAYKIHLVYNAMVLPAERARTTISDSVELMPISWDIVATPIELAGRRKTAHYVIDSRDNDPQALAVLESYLYGSAFMVPQLLTPQSIAALLGGWSHINFPGSINYQGPWPQTEKSELKNLATKPSFETAGSSVEVWRNLATNPSFETSGSAVEVRRNHCPNPVPASTTGYGGANGATVTFVASPYPAIEVVVPAGGSMDSGVTITNRAAWAVGEVWTVSFDLEAVTAGVYRTVYTGAGLPGIAENHTLAAGEKRRISLTTTVTTQAAGSIYIVRPANLNSYTFRVSRILIAAGVAGSYFDGTTSPDPDLTPAWTGAANASASTLSAPAPASAPPLNLMASVWSAQWSASGSRSLRTLSLTSGNDSNRIIVAGSTGSLAGLNVTFVAGQTYTALVKMRLAAPLTGSLSGRALRLLAYADGNMVGQMAGTNTAGVQDLRLTFTVPAGATNAYVMLSGGSSIGNGDVWWDNLCIVEGVYTGPYFDGDYSPDSDLTPAWVGTANASASTLSGTLPAGVPNGFPERAARVQSTQWVKSGTKSVRVIPLSTATDLSYAECGAVAVTGGQVYTIMATIRLAAPLAGSLNAMSRQFWLIGNAANTITYLTSIPLNAAGVYEVRGHFTAAITGSINLRLMNGATAGNGDVWWDNLAIVPGVYTGPYFDGSIPDDTIYYQKQPLEFSWASTPNNSASIGTYYTNLPENPRSGDLYEVEDALYLYTGERWERAGSMPI